MIRIGLAIGLALFLPALSGKEVPFPAGHTAILREEKVVYVVEGRIRIPEGVEVTCLKDVHIVGRGSDAVIEVVGRLKVHGIEKREVIFENVTIELSEKFESVHMDQVIFRKGAAVRTAAEKPAKGKRFFLELADFRDDAELSLTVFDCPITLSSTCSDRPVTIRAVDPPGKEENRVKLIVRGCVEGPGHPGLVGGLIVTNVFDASVRINLLGGNLTAFRECRTLLCDGNKVTSRTLEFRQSAKGSFGRSKVMKCDVYSTKVVAVSPAAAKKKRDQIKMDRCWFGGIENPKAVRAKVLSDGLADAKNAALIVLGKVNGRPLELAGKWNR